jgi:hypothetical protein
MPGPGWWQFGALLFLGLAAGEARADAFSPGPLSQAHAKLEGITNCTQCHVAGGQLAEGRCLACHTELKDRIAQGKGFHGALASDARSCSQCHHEHQGRDFALIDWAPRGKAGFDHKKAGFPLLGKHASASCASCHAAPFIEDAAARALLSHPGRETYLGVATRCTACHFDEHRGQLGASCRDCHTEASFKPAPGFDHAKTDFALEGAHRKVACAACHANVLDVALVHGAVPAPRSETFQRFKPVAHASCLDCHKDPHEGRFGQSCTSCHTVASWHEVKSSESDTSARAFHQKTAFPLEGAHALVVCRSCHGPFRGAPALFKGLRHDRCLSCHIDAHEGQLGKATDCERCHTVQGFLPVHYEPRDHVKFALAGAHALVACNGCHREDPALAARVRPVRAFLQRRGRHDAISLMQFHPPGNLSRCNTCHADAHRGQFAARVRQAGCADCHRTDSFANVRFDHARESRFPLTGSHEKLACAACHVADSHGVTRFKPLETACSACHADPHVGQFAEAGSVKTDCARCHGTASFARTTFVHGPPFTQFALEGRHASLACAACHREVALPGAVKAIRYAGLPTSCEGCHVDAHKGAFRELAQ